MAISQYVKSFVKRKLEQLERSAEKSSGSYPELFEQKFTDSGGRLWREEAERAPGNFRGRQKVFQGVGEGLCAGEVAG